MKQYQITTPDGKMMTVEGPEDATDDELIAFVKTEVAKSSPKYKNSPTIIRRAVEHPEISVPLERDTANLSMGVKRNLSDQRAFGYRPGLGDLFTNGATFGLSDEAAGAFDAVGNVLSSPFTGNFDPKQAYLDGRDTARLNIQQAQKDSPVLGTLAQVAGGFAGFNPAAVAAPVPNALAAIRSGARGGALAGAVGGFGSGEGAENSLVQGAFGGAFGGALGGAVPLAGVSASSVINGANRFLGRDTQGLSRQIVGNALAADANTGAGAGAMMDTAHDLGVPYMLADTGENARTLAASVSRQPGRSRTIVRDAVTSRQQQQGGRIRGFVERDLGPVGNTFDASNALQQQARTDSRPLYEQAYAAPVIHTPELEAILGTPAGRQALGRAQTIAANERRDPTAMGFRLDDNGEAALDPTLHIGEDASGNLTVSQQPSQHRGYTTQTIDYVKRGLDDVVESRRDPVTRRLPTDEDTRAINGVRASLVREADRLNPAYGAARAAYAGPASARQALQQGKDALNYSDEELERAVRNLTEGDREQFGLGYRSALVNSLDRRVDGADKARAVLGTPRKRAALTQLFGGGDELARFETTLGLEQAANDTYRSVATGSQTAERNAADAQTMDPGLVETAFDTAARGAQGGVGGMALALLGRVRATGQFGQGEAGNRVRQSVASLLTETDPAALREALQQANAAAQAQQARAQVIYNRTIQGGQGVSPGLAVAAGNAGDR